MVNKRKYFSTYYNLGKIMKKTQKLSINCTWDAEASVWVASSEDILGLSIEAESIELMNARLKEVIPELMGLNSSQHIPKEIPYHLHSDMDCVAYA